MARAAFGKKLLREVRIEVGKISAGFRVGVHRSIMRGRGLTFKGLKPYEDGDSLVEVDWTTSARLSYEDTELVSRIHEPERTLSVVVLLDDGISMSHPPKKQECAAFLLWLFAASAFKHQDKFRCVFFSSESPVSSEWLTREESLEEFFLNAEHPQYQSHHANLQLFLAELRLHDALIAVVSDFWGDEWRNDAFRFRHLASVEKNIRLAYFALDEWSGFTPVSFSAALRNPFGGSSRLFSLRSGEEAAAQREAQQSCFAAAKKALRVGGAPFIPIPIFEDFPRHVYRELLKCGFE